MHQKTIPYFTSHLHGSLDLHGPPVGSLELLSRLKKPLIHVVGLGSCVAFATVFAIYLVKSDRQQPFRTLGATLRISTFPIPNRIPFGHNITQQNMTEAREQFLEIVGHRGIDSDPGNLEARSSTEWSRSPVDTYASLILFPQDTLQVSRIMKICHKRHIPVTGYSGGTSLDGALAATRGGICIDFSRMNKILRLHERDMDVVVQPGVGWEHLNEYLARSGLFFPPDPGPGAQIGGMIGTGCSGTNSYRYGTMKDWVISATIVLADGTIVKTRNRPRKSTAGYDLTRLLVGSSGTLGLVTEAVLKVTAKPQNEQVIVITFHDTYKAVNTAIDAVQQGLPLAALELLDETTMKAVNQSGYATKAWSETPTLFIKINGTKTVVQEQMDVIGALAQKYDRETFESSADPEEIDALWSARKTALWSLIAQKRHPDDKFISSDVAVPISRLADIIEEAKDMIKQAGLLGSTLGHVGDGMSLLF